jgi:hypothetical protein
MDRAGGAFVSPVLIGPAVSFLGAAGPIFVLGRVIGGPFPARSMCGERHIVDRSHALQC